MVNFMCKLIFKRASLFVSAALLLGVFWSYAGAAEKTAVFKGIDKTYILSGGRRILELKGTSGVYIPTTLSGTQSLPVELTRDTLAVAGGTAWAYVAKRGLLLAGPLEGFDSAHVISNPGEVAGTYTTINGANFPGVLKIDQAGYFWCQKSLLLPDNTCADRTLPKRGTIAVQLNGGFKFSGTTGTYAVYRRGDAAAIFAVDVSSLRLMAVSQPKGKPKGSFIRPTVDTSFPDKGNLIRVKFDSAAKRLKISGATVWEGEYPYAVDSGVISITSSRCPDGMCFAIYNKSLGILHFPRLDSRTFVLE